MICTRLVLALTFSCHLILLSADDAREPELGQGESSHLQKTDNLNPPLMAVYRWAAPKGVAQTDAFAAWLNRTLIWAEDFEGNETWDGVENPGWLLKPWSEWVQKMPGRRLILGVVIIPGGWDGKGPKTGIDAGKPVSLEAGARGEYNHHFRKLAENLVKYKLENSILRPGWEFNGNWYAWRAQKKEKEFAEYWRQIVKTMREVPGAEKLEYCWNPALGYVGFPAEKAYPGDEFVDYIGLDVYDDAYVPGTYPWPAGSTPDQIKACRMKAWDEVTNSSRDHGLAWWVKFASEHKKPLALPEWGVNNKPDKHGGGDNPMFVENMHKFITDPANNVRFHCYFDVEAPDGHHQLSPGLNGTHNTEFPESSAKFKELFSIPAILGN